jgi:hypothetical protein
VTGATTQVLTDKDYGPQDDPRSLYMKWNAELDFSNRAFHRWEERAKKVDKRYRDERESQAIPSPKKFNVLWSNIQVLLPAHWSRNPEPVVKREHDDEDPVGRVATQILERSIKATIDQDNFFQVMEGVTLDRLLTSRGTAWVRYVPSFRKVQPEPIAVEPVTQDGAAPGEKPGQFRLPDGTLVGSDAVQITDDTEYLYAPPPYDEVAYDEVVFDYVHWSDFRHTSGRRWSEVWWVARKVHFSKDEVTARFDTRAVMERTGRTATVANDLQYTFDAAKENGSVDSGAQTDAYKKAEIWEIWDRHRREVIWLAKGYANSVLDRLPDPLKLSGFFPCPRPLYGTMSTNSLEPVPDYYEYQDQASQLDDLTDRISLLAEALAVKGVYNKQVPELQRLLGGAPENTMIPVDNWAIFAEKGGLVGAVDFFPLDVVSNTLTGLVNQREVIKRDLYEISGISDIIRGEGRAEETATAQALKGRFATLRLSRSQQDVQRFARDLIRLGAEVMCEHLQPNTLMLMSSFDLLSANDPEEQALFEPAIQLLRSNKLRAWRIDIETDSTIALDEEAERKGITEYLTALSQVMPQMGELMAAQPALAPWAVKTLKMAARKFRAGREVEDALDKGLDKILEQAQQPKPPDPKVIEATAKAEKTKMDIANTQSQIEERGKRIQLDTVKLLGDQSVQKSQEERNDAEAMHDMALSTIDVAVQPVRGVEGGMRMQ